MSTATVHPPLAVDTILNHRYRILKMIGIGGMGQVYLAQDEQLGRQVAIKTVHESGAAESESRARFEREARLLAALNHPHIAVLHGLEEVETQLFLVMEFVPGPTLAKRLLQGPLPLNETLRLGIQLADALATAHDQGIIHRDLKPANLKITPEGRIKVLDFGLATTHVRNTGLLPTQHLTREGTVMGTPAYMSPEQVAGEETNSRTDIWAYGCVLFEMLTGLQAFPGKTTRDIFAHILKGDPDWSRLPDEIPERFKVLLQRCIRRDLNRRLHHLADARIELEDLLNPSTTSVSGRPQIRLGRRAVLLTLAGITGGYFAGRWFANPVVSHSTEWAGELLLSGSIGPWDPQISPDGQWLAFVHSFGPLLQVAVMRLGSLTYRILTSEATKGRAHHPCWSQDGNHIYFTRTTGSTTNLFSVAFEGGFEKPVLENADNPQTLPDGTLLVGRQDQNGVYHLVRYNPGTGIEEPLKTPLGWYRTQWSFRACADGREVVCWEALPPDAPTGDAPRLGFLNLATDTMHFLEPPIYPTSSYFPELAVDPSGKTVYVGLPGDGKSLSRVLAVSRSTGTRQTILTTTNICRAMSAGADGSLFLTQTNVHGELLRFTRQGKTPERLARVVGEWTVPLQLPDGRILFGEVISGRHRVIAIDPGKGNTPFVTSDEETWLPGAVFGPRHVALFIGPIQKLDVVIVEIGLGRIVHRYKLGLNTVPTSVAASSEKKTIYLTHRNRILSLAEKSTTPKQISEGSGVALSADGRSLFITRATSDGVHLYRRTIEGKDSTEITIQGSMAAHQDFLVGNAVNQKGEMLGLFTTPKSYWNVAGLLDPESGKVQAIPVDYEGDLFNPSWGSDDLILALGYTWQSAIWRFHPRQTT